MYRIVKAIRKSLSHTHTSTRTKRFIMQSVTNGLKCRIFAVEI